MSRGGVRINAGRKAGIPNRMTAEIKEILSGFLLKNIGDIQKRYDALDDRDKIYFIEKLLKYFLPTHLENNVDLTEKTVVVFRREETPIRQ